MLWSEVETGVLVCRQISGYAHDKSAGTDVFLLRKKFRKCRLSFVLWLRSPGKRVHCALSVL